MSSVRSPIVRVMVQVASAPETPETLLESVGLGPVAGPAEAMNERVDAEAYYGLLERAAVPDDHGLPYRYAEALHPDAFSALGLGLKTADTLRESWRRLVRYILLLSDTLEYQLRDHPDGAATLVLLRPHHRRGAAMANECALAAATRLLRVASGKRITPTAVTFCHDRPASITEAHSFFGCPVRYGERSNGVQIDGRTLDTRARLADEGLSSFLISQLEQMRYR